MRTLATGTSNDRLISVSGRLRGFTLIEVLVVVVIVGIISSVVLLSTSLIDDERGIRREARRLASLVELAGDEALLQGRDFGLELVRGGYRFVEYDPLQDRWFEVPGDDLLRPRRLPESLEFELYVEDRRVLLSDEHARLGNEEDRPAGERRADYAPHTLILSSGQLSPFELRLLREDAQSGIELRVTPAGEIEIDENPDDES